MSSSTALLPKPNKKDEHSIFLRVCHSPWVSISQSALVAIRGFVAAYLSFVFVVFIYRDVTRSDRGWLIPFEFSNIIYLLQTIYAWVAFTWTYMHLYNPHQSSSGSSLSPQFKAHISPPRQNPATNNREIFSIFYTAVVVFPHVATLVYWLIFIPHEHTTPVDIFRYDWFNVFCILNRYGINSIIALIEIIVLSSIKRQDPVWIHAVGLSTICVVYVCWVYVGRLATGRFAYFFFDFQEHGWEYVLVSLGSFIGLTNTFFAVTYGITGLREMLTNENKGTGYSRLPQ